MVVEFQIHGTFEIKAFRKICVRDCHQNLADAAHKYTKIVFFSAIAENEFSKFASEKSLVMVENTQQLIFDALLPPPVSQSSWRCDVKPCSKLGNIDRTVLV